MENMKKKVYEKPNAEIIYLNDDIITTSGDDPDHTLPENPDQNTFL